MATTNRIPAETLRNTLAVAMAAAAKVASTDAIRDDLKAGSLHKVRLSLAADVDGTPIHREWSGTVEVGHDATRASSVGVKAGELLAYLLSRVNEATREATLRDLADTFGAYGRLPVADADVEKADEALGRLRQKVTQQVRGSVRVAMIAAEPVAVAPVAPVAMAAVAEPVPVAAAARKATKPAAKPAAKAKAKK